MPNGYLPLSPADTAIVLVDHQPGVLAMVGSLPASVITSNVAMLARLGEEMELPLLITSTREKLEFLGTNLPEIQAAGYRVIIPADASGTTSALADAVTYDRLRSVGAEVASAYGILFELYSDLSTPDGQRAEAIAAASVSLS